MLILTITNIKHSILQNLIRTSDLFVPNNWTAEIAKNKKTGNLFPVFLFLALDFYLKNMGLSNRAE